MKCAACQPMEAVGTVSGASTIIVEDVIGHYAGAENIVDRNEAINAVVDYFNMIISKEDAQEKGWLTSEVNTSEEIFTVYSIQHRH